HHSVLSDDEYWSWWIVESRQWLEKQRSGYFDKGNANHWLHFQHLDWKRRRLLHWHEQSGFNHDEWTYHRNSDLYPLKIGSDAWNFFRAQTHCTFEQSYQRRPFV